MKHYVTSVCLFLTTLIFLITICVLSCSAKMTAYLYQKQDSLIVARGLEGLDDVHGLLENDFREKVFLSSREAYMKLSELLYDEGDNITEEEATDYYRKTTLQLVKEKYGLHGNTSVVSGTGITDSVNTLIPKMHIGQIDFGENCSPYFELSGDTISLKDICTEFKYGTTYRDSDEFDVSAHIDDIVFYDENPELFRYSMIAGKGIYITGKTSTVIGDIYAGTHGPKELRKAEALYGESDFYGGLNIMSTQIAIEADKISTDGNLNMKGAFVVFGSEDRPVSIYAKGVLESDNLANKNMYALFGKVEDSDTSSDKAMADEAMRYLGSIEHYYDSNNDKSYTGKYRKLISSTDITVSDDVTGVIMTPGSVIIEEDVNVEGLILCGDRIYIQGNNNIVSSVEILRDIVKEELYQNAYTNEEYSTDEERALNKIHLKMTDHMGGILRRGFVGEEDE